VDALYKSTFTYFTLLYFMFTFLDLLLAFYLPFLQQVYSSRQKSFYGAYSSCYFVPSSYCFVSFTITLLCIEHVDE